jgi:hypothetical protein
LKEEAMRWRTGWVALFLLLFLPLLLSGCLLTLGGPLSRRVEPGRWQVEAAAAPSLANEYGALNVLAYGYAGYPLGRHWEVGAMPYVYTWETEGVLAAGVPVRWDPFPYRWSVHLVPFAGPVVFWVPGTGFGAGGMGGLGFSLRIGELAELYASGSIFLPGTEFLSASFGTRFDLANGFTLGLGGVMVTGGGSDSGGDSRPVVFGGVTLSTLLKSK